MHCSEAESQIVAWQDGELAPSAEHQLVEHVSRCRSCAERAARLDACTPRPITHLAPQHRAALDEALNVDLILAEADRQGPLSTPWRVPRWVRGESEVSHLSLLAYAALLALTFGWGLANWNQGSASGSTAAAVDAHASEIPAGQFAPASYTPEDEAVLP